VWIARWSASATRIAVTDPPRARAALKGLWVDIKHEAAHYWLGTRLLGVELGTSAGLLRRLGSGAVLTRREHMQLKRSLNDILKMVPFVIIVIIPFAELGLPVLLKLFPNMLPSQFEKAELRQEAYRRSLAARLELHGILQEILADRTSSKVGAAATGGEDAAALAAQLEAVRRGDPLPSSTVVAVARLFKDELTLDTLPKMQLAPLAKYCGFSPFAPEAVLRVQLRQHFKALAEDDTLLAAEGTAGMSRDELKSACEARGMRAVGLTPQQYRAQLDEWLALAVGQRVPAVLLLLSRAFSLGGPASAAIQEQIANIDPRTVSEQLLATAAAAPSASPLEAQKLKLDTINLQNDLIAAEREAAEAQAAADKAGAGGEAAGLRATAASKAAVVVRMRAVDATRAAASTSTPVAPPREGGAAPTGPAAAAEGELLATVAQRTSVGRERAILNQLRALQARGEANTAMEKATTAGGAAAAAEDSTTRALRQQLEGLGAGLEKEIAAREETLHARLEGADGSSDGVLDRAEVAKLLRSVAHTGGRSDEAAAAIMRRLDTDGDGKVTLAELEALLEKLSADALPPKV
jgi:LETM1 and EF-hand domain-containing protein 1